MFAQWLEGSVVGGRLDAFHYSPPFVAGARRLAESEIPTRTLESLGEKASPISYGILQPREFLATGGVPMVRAVDLGEPAIDMKRVVAVPTSVEEPYRRSRLEAGDVLLSIAGTLGTSSTVPSGVSLANINQSVARIRITDADPYFVCAYLRSKTGQLLLERENVGSVQRHLNIEDVRLVRIPVPDRGHQEEIGHKLRTAEQNFSDSLRLMETARDEVSRLIQNRCRTTTWPTVDEMPSRATPWRTDPAEIGPRLDAEFYLPEYRELVRRLRATGATRRLAEIERDGSYGILPDSDDYGAGDLPLVRGGDLDGFPLHGVPKTAPRVPAKYLASKRGRLRPSDVLLLIKGANIGEPESVGAVPSDWPHDAVVNGSVYKFAVLPPHDPFYVCAFMSTEWGLKQKIRAVANTGISYNDQEAIRDFVLFLPDPGLQREIGDRVSRAGALRRSAYRLFAEAPADVDALLARGGS